MGHPGEVEVAIVGGGLGGLALAAGLRRRGFDAHVFEGASELRRETSTMIGLGPNAFAALGDIHPELPDELKQRGVTIHETVLRNLPPDQEPTCVVRTNEVKLHTIRWAEAQDVLAQLVPPEVIHCDHAATGYDEIWDEQGAADDGDSAVDGGAAGNGASFSAPTRPASRAVVHFRGQPSVAARLVVGADGVFSAIRAAMHPGDPGPRYLGHMNWNCVFPNPGGNTVVDAHKPGQLIVASDGSMGPNPRDMTLHMYVSDAGLEHTFIQVRIQSDEPAFTSELAGVKQAAAPPPEAGKEEPAAGEGENGAADGGGGGSDSGGGDAQGDGGRRRGRGGMGVPGSKARVLEILRSAGWHWALPLLEAVPERCLFERALYDRLPLPRWSSRGGRVVLLGDSAHAMHPGPGQGARSAFEDAHQLVLALEAAWPDVPAAMERYQRARIVRANRLQRFAAEGAGLAAIRDAVRPAGLSPQDRRLRFDEFRTWFDQYPNNMEGDPNTKWWKPLSGDGGAGGGAGDGCVVDSGAGEAA